MKTWSLTETGTTFHSFNSAGVAICRSNIRQGASQGTRTEEQVDAFLGKPWSGIGHSKCSRCAVKEAAHRDRVSASLEPSTGEGDYLPPAKEEKVAHEAVQVLDDVQDRKSRVLYGYRTGESKLKALDLFTGVGGAYRGYEQAGFDVTGVDIAAQPDHPGRFIQGDAIEYVLAHGHEYDFIGASAPCQRYNALTAGTNRHLKETYADLIGPTRDALNKIGVPYAIENPASRPDVVLCGEMFGLRVIRHRNFELGGWSTTGPKEPKHKGLTLGMRHGKLITPAEGGHYFPVYGSGGYKGTIAQWQDAMGIHWTANRKSIAEAIPPAYAEWIGTEFLRRNT